MHSRGHARRRARQEAEEAGKKRLHNRQGSTHAAPLRSGAQRRAAAVRRRQGLRRLALHTRMERLSLVELYRHVASNVDDGRRTNNQGARRDVSSQVSPRFSARSLPSSAVEHAQETSCLRATQVACGYRAPVGLTMMASRPGPTPM